MRTSPGPPHREDVTRSSRTPEGAVPARKYERCGLPRVCALPAGPEVLLARRGGRRPMSADTATARGRAGSYTDSDDTAGLPIVSDGHGGWYGYAGADQGYDQGYAPDEYATEYASDYG